MSKISKPIPLLLIIGIISSMTIRLNENKKQAIEITIGFKVEYDKNRNFFIFKFEGSSLL